MRTGNGAPQRAELPEQDAGAHAANVAPPTAGRRIGRRQFLLLLAASAIALAGGLGLGRIGSPADSGDSIHDGQVPSDDDSTRSPSSNNTTLLDSAGKPVLDSDGREIQGR